MPVLFLVFYILAIYKGDIRMNIGLWMCTFIATLWEARPLPLWEARPLALWHDYPISYNYPDTEFSSVSLILVMSWNRLIIKFVLCWFDSTVIRTCHFWPFEHAWDRLGLVSWLVVGVLHPGNIYDDYWLVTVHTHGNCYNAAPLGEKAASTMTCYPNQSQYRDTPLTIFALLHFVLWRCICSAQNKRIGLVYTAGQLFLWVSSLVIYDTLYLASVIQLQI